MSQIFFFTIFSPSLMFYCIRETTSLAEHIDASDMDQYKTIMFAGNFGLFLAVFLKC